MIDVTRSNLIGGEMLNWSDLHPGDARPAAAGPAATALLAAVLQPDDTVLIAGPHGADVITAAVGQVTSVDLLLRSAPDAEELAELLDDAKGQVFCGSLDRWVVDETYDVIVALDGLERLVGPDTASFPWVQALDRLRERLRPGGRLLLGATNSFGFERLIQPDITAALPRDEDWGRPAEDRAPAGFKQLTAALHSTLPTEMCRRTPFSLHLFRLTSRSPPSRDSRRWPPRGLLPRATKVLC